MRLVGAYAAVFYSPMGHGGGRGGFGDGFPRWWIPLTIEVSEKPSSALS